jgi:two-component system sensor histidine kinase BaeS
MRLRLILSFLIVVFVSIASMMIIARIKTANEIRTFMYSGEMTGNEELVSRLEDYYQANKGWQGIDRLFTERGHGMRMGQGQGMMGGMGNDIRLLNAQGEVLIDTSGLEDQVAVTREDINNALPIVINKQTVGYLLSSNGSMVISRGNEAKLVKRVNRAAIIAGLITAILSLVIVSFLAYKLFQPIHELTLATERIAEGDLSQRVPVHGDDELATLGSAFNRMADSLEKAENNRRVMTADIAHELRNPLAVQRANLEAMQDGIYDMTPENVQPLIDQNLLLTRLVEDLRTLALADAGQLELVRVDADFPALVKRALERFQPQADTKNIRLELINTATCPPIFIDPGRIEQILGNLLSNAFRFTPESGKISLEINCTPKNIRLDVHDSGPGIPEESLPHLFERFYRADKARSRAEGGSGLGLAIARKIAEAHGGSLTAANHPQGGAVISLTLPFSG